MEDNFEFTPGTGGVGAADNIGGVLHQRVKIQHGTDGHATDVSRASPLPVAAATLPLPTNAATQTTLSALNDKVTAVNTGAVVVSSSALPADAATQTTLASVDGKLPALSSGRVPVDPSGVTSPVSAASLPLPSGAAIEAKQETGNRSLSSSHGQLPALSSGRVSVDGSGVTQPVSGTVAATQSGAWNVGIVEKTFSYATAAVATSGDNTLVAAPGSGNRLVVTAFVIQNESSTATTLILKSASTNRFRFLGQTQGDGMQFVFPVGQAWKLAENEALVLNLSGANSCGYSIQYYTEAV
jgi:hypothetical protein